MDNVYCDGTEEELAKCRFSGWKKTDCESGEAAGVICMNDKEEISSELTSNMVKEVKVKIKDFHQRGMAIRLSGGLSPSEGRVEIYLENSGTYKFNNNNNNIYIYIYIYIYICLKIQLQVSYLIE